MPCTEILLTKLKKIPQNRNDLYLNEEHIINKEEEELYEYYLLVYNKYDELENINYYKRNKLIKKYKYSGKGNLVNLFHYNYKKQKVVKEIFDYSLGKKELKEKRFYIRNMYSKKECYKDGSLHEIIYYKDGVKYCIEYFFNHQLKKVKYFNQAGFEI